MNVKRTILYAMLMGMVALGALQTAAADATSENVTKMKDSIVETLATWVPFVVLFTLLGIALGAIGLKLFKGN